MATAAVTTEPLIVGNLTIPAENAEEWTRLNEEAHQLNERGEEMPRSMRMRLLVLEGATEGEAELLTRSPATAECDDTHDR
jgi:hypothetical protein